MGTILVQDSHSLGAKVNLLQDSSGIGIVDDPFGFFLGSEIGLTLGDILDSDHGPPVDILLIMNIPTVSKVI